MPPGPAELGPDVVCGRVGERDAEKHLADRDVFGENAGRHVGGLSGARSGDLDPHEATFFATFIPRNSRALWM